MLRNLSSIIYSFLILFLITDLSAAVNRDPVLSLNGEWQFSTAEPIVDIVENRSSGDFDPPQYHPELDSLIPPPARHNPAEQYLQDVQWIPVQVPSAWEQVAGIDYNGAGWYRHVFEIPENWLKKSQRLWIEFDAVATAAGVWLNGKWSGGNVGDYSRWRVEVTEAAVPGQNELLVYVDELPGHIHQGFLSVVMPHHGGIWQEVRCYPTGNTALMKDGLHLAANPETGELKITAELEGGWNPQTTFAALRLSRLQVGNSAEKAGSINIEKDNELFRFDEGKGRLYAVVNIPEFELWSPENPQLYQAEFILSSGDFQEKIRKNFAFRSIEIKGSTVFLNDSPLNIRSVLNWGQYPRIVSPAPPAETVKEEFLYFRSLGLNAETVCLMIMPDYFYDIADE
ncbi:MAG: sugar-binding domain-containing protein, partial [Calditrichia bacterium]